MRLGVILLAGLLAGAGCLSDGGAKDQAPGSSAPSNTGELDLRPVEADPNEVRSLEAAPKWRSGEWWTYRVEDRFTGSVFETTRIVAGQEGDNYLVGMPRDAWVNDLMVFHVPGFGEIDQSDLSFEVHDVPFEPLQFPLTDGASWDTAWEGQPITVDVAVKSPTTAEITVTGAIGMTGLYDAEAGEIVGLDIDNYALVQVTGHGYDWAGVVTVPHMHDLIFVNFRFAGLLAQDGPVPTPFGALNPVPQDEVMVNAGYDRVSFALIVGTFSPSPMVEQPPPGLFSETAKAPDGTEYKVEVLPPSTELAIETFEHRNPGGTWTFTHVAAGVGIALTEGIAYHVYDVQMPEGCVLPSEGEHAHGGCGLAETA